MVKTLKKGDMCAQRDFCYPKYSVILNFYRVLDFVHPKRWDAPFTKQIGLGKGILKK